MAQRAVPTRSGFAVHSSMTHCGRASDPGIHLKRTINICQDRFRKRIALSVQRPATVTNSILLTETCNASRQMDTGGYAGERVALLCHSIEKRTDTRGPMRPRVFSRVRWSDSVRRSGRNLLSRQQRDDIMPLKTGPPTPGWRDPTAPWPVYRGCRTCRISGAPTFSGTTCRARPPGLVRPAPSATIQQRRR